MSQYQYSPLSQSPDSLDRIRLLRLLPANTEARHEEAEIRCELFEYPLQSSNSSTHLYEALSYVWGSPENRRSIRVNGSELLVTENLYAALLHLRNAYLARVIWIDAICIDQENHHEKKRQIQLMSKIYGLAQRVVVWLGEATDMSDVAMGGIRMIAEQRSPNLENFEVMQGLIISLLRRPWFERIWVLQEVAAARHVLIMCGRAQIEGQAFCLGVESLNDSELGPDLRRLVHSLSYLMRGAIFRSKYETRGPGPAENFHDSPLGSLVDMYHSRKATDRRDKIFALLSMSFDPDFFKSGLSPDYDIPWDELMERLVKFILGEGVLVDTSSDREVAVIQSKGCVLGYVCSVEDNFAGAGRQNMNIKFKKLTGEFEYRALENYTTHWALRTSAKTIKRGDIVCLLQGARKPSIIRLNGDFFAVIVISAVLEEGDTHRQSFDVFKFCQSIKVFPHDFPLVWNWDDDPRAPRDRNEYKILFEAEGQQQHYPETQLDGRWDSPTRLLHIGLILGDFEIHDNQTRGDYDPYEEAEWRLREAAEGCEQRAGKGASCTLRAMDSLAFILQRRKQWAKAENLLAQVLRMRKRSQGEDHPDFLGSLNNLAATFQGQGRRKRVKKVKTMIYFLERRKDNPEIIMGNGVIRIVVSLNEETMVLQCRWNKVIYETIEAAADNVENEYAVMGGLLALSDTVQTTALEGKAEVEGGGNEVKCMFLEPEKDSHEILKTLRGAPGSERHGGNPTLGFSGVISLRLIK